MNKAIKIKNLFILSSLVILSACGSKNSNHDSSPAPAAPAQASPATSGGYTQFGCSVQGSQGSVLVQAPSQAHYTNIGGLTGQFEIQICLQILGDSNQIALLQSQNKSAAFYYNGNINLGGVINFTSTATMGQCVIPAGSYAIQNSIPGFYNPLSFSVNQFEAVSGTNKIIFQLRSGWTKDPDANFLVDRFALDLVALSVQANGVGQSNCNDLLGLFLN